MRRISFNQGLLWHARDGFRGAKEMEFGSEGRVVLVRKGVGFGREGWVIMIRKGVGFGSEGRAGME